MTTHFHFILERLLLKICFDLSLFLIQPLQKRVLNQDDMPGDADDDEKVKTFFWYLPLSPLFFSHFHKLIRQQQ